MVVPSIYFTHDISPSTVYYLYIYQSSPLHNIINKDIVFEMLLFFIHAWMYSCKLVMFLSLL
jgi:hypothetical protein